MWNTYAVSSVCSVTVEDKVSDVHEAFQAKTEALTHKIGQNWGACRLICGETKTEAFLPAAEGSCAPRKSCPIIDLNKSKDYGQNLPIATAFEKKQQAEVCCYIMNSF